MAARRTVRVGLIGYGFMGKAHSNAWRQAPRLFDLPTEIEMSPLCGRDARALKKAAATLGWKKSASDRRTVVEDPEIDLVDVATPNDSHAEIALARELSMRGELGERLFHFCARFMRRTGSWTQSFRLALLRSRADESAAAGAGISDRS